MIATIARMVKYIASAYIIPAESAMTNRCWKIAEAVQRNSTRLKVTYVMHSDMDQRPLFIRRQSLAGKRDPGTNVTMGFRKMA